MSHHHHRLFFLPLCSNVLILNPNVGEIVSIGSPLNLLSIVVFPALSRPLLNEIIEKFLNSCETLGNLVPVKLKWNENKWKFDRETHSNKIRISFSFCRIFLSTVRNPILTSWVD